MNIRAVFDTERFWSDVDHIRKERDVSWNQINHATGITCVHESSRSDNPLLDTLVLVAVWAGISLDAYVQVFDRAGQVEYPHRYDVARFYADLDRVRIARKLTWHGVFRAAPNTAVPWNLSTFAAKQIALNPKAREALAIWANLSFSDYLEQDQQP